MRTLRLIPIAVLLWLNSAFPQSNKIVFGPLEGDNPGVLTVRNGEDIQIEMWVRTDPENPTPVVAVCHGLISENMIIVERNGIDPEPYYDSPPWEQVWVDGPYTHDSADNYPIPQGYTCEMQVALWCIFFPCSNPLDTQGEWDYYGAFLMTCNTDVPIDDTYYPLSIGWYPHSGQGTFWAFATPPGGGVVPEQSYCGLYVESNVCSYIPGDCDHNGTPLELNDVLAIIGFYRGTIEPYLCECGEDPPVYNFAATADPNGNCIPNELNDAVTEIAAYRGTMTASGCPDCPGSGPLLIGQDKER